MNMLQTLLLFIDPFQRNNNESNNKYKSTIKSHTSYQIILNNQVLFSLHNTKITTLFLSLHKQRLQKIYLT